MTDRLEALGQEFTKLRAESKRLRASLDRVRLRLVDIRPEIAEAIAESVRENKRSLGEIRQITGYTDKRIKQICTERNVDAGE